MRNRWLLLGVVFSFTACHEPGEEAQRNAADLAFTEEAREPLTTAAACSGAPGGGSFCGPTCPCDDGEGDCDADDDCAPGLRCYRDVGAAFGFGGDVDVCMAQCPNVGDGSLDFCTEECPCTSEQGDCDSDAECADGLRCEHDLGAAFGFDAEVDVCVEQCSPFRAGKFDYCSAECPCAAGQGDCDSDAECGEGLRCGKDLGAEYGFDAEVDVCVGASATTSVRVTIVDVEGLPIPGARATLHGVEGTADDGGVITFESVTPGRTAIPVRAAGHTEASLDVQLVQGEHRELTATLHSLGQPIPFDAGQGAEIIHEAVRINVPAGALVDAGGAPVEGEVAVTIARIAPEQAVTDIGSSRAIRAGEEVALEKGRVVDIAFWQGDEQLQIQPGAAVTVDVPLLDAENPGLQPGDTMTIYTYDTTQGAWVEDVLGTVMSTDDGQLFVRAEIEHTCWFWFWVWYAFYGCHLPCQVCNPCDWRPCSSHFCELRHELYLVNEPSAPPRSACIRYGFRADGTPLPSGSQVSGDCRDQFCDIRFEQRWFWWWSWLEAVGFTVDTAANDGDRPDDANLCTSDSCVSGSPTFTPVPSGTSVPGLPQTPNNCLAMACDGRGGQMQIDDDTDVPADDGNPCTDQSCSAGAVVLTPVPAGTVVAGLPQAEQDCRVNVCDGNGGETQIADGDDTPADDGNQCTDNVCDDMYASYPPVAAGTFCDQGGLYCNGDRDCVDCLSDDQCTSLVCSELLGRCLPPTCEDGVKNGAESAVDCGGPECDPCAAGAVCSAFGDCQSLICAAGRCAPARCTDFVHNGEETDVDCGGPLCGGCAEGLRCFSASDCAGDLVCSAGVCTAP